MRMEISCYTPVLPEDYRRVALSLLKGLVKSSRPELYHRLYVEERFRKKPYTFTMVFKGKRIGSFYYLQGERFKLILATSSPLFASAVMSSVARRIPVTVNLTDNEQAVVVPSSLKVVPEKFSENVLIKDFVLPEDWLLVKYPEHFKGLNLKEKVTKYLQHQGYTFKTMRIYRKRTVFGIEGFKNRNFTCWDLKLYGVKGELPKLYQEGIGHYKSQGFGFPIPLS